MIPFLILFILLVCLPAWGTQVTNSYITEYVEPSLSVATYTRKTFNENILITTSDGFVHYYHANGEKVWSCEIKGGALVSSFHPIRNDGGVYPSRVDSVGTMIPSVSGSVLSYIGGELRTLGMTVSELVDQTPKLASDGSLFLGSKQSTVFGIDLKRGKLVDMGDNQSDTVWFARIDYLVRSVERGSGTEMWNFTFSKLEPLSGMGDIQVNRSEVNKNLDEEDEYAVSELQLVADGTCTKLNSRGDESAHFKLGLSSPITSAFMTTPMSVPSPPHEVSESGVLLLSDSKGESVTTVGVKELNIKHHLQSSSTATSASSRQETKALVAQVESSQFDDYSSLFAIEYIANKKDIEASYMSLTTTAKPCLLEKLKGSTLPRLPTPRLITRKDSLSKSVKPASSPLCKAPLNQSALSLVKLQGLPHRTCQKGGGNFPECIVGLHLLRHAEEDGDVSGEGGRNSTSSYFSLEHLQRHLHSQGGEWGGKKQDKPAQSKYLVLAVLLMLCVSWLKDHNLLSSLLNGTWGYLTLSSPSSPSSKVVEADAEGNLNMGSLNVTNEKLGHGSLGTIVFRGSLDGRPIAVKRMLCDYQTTARREIKLLIESDGHPNVVRYFSQETNGSFVYLALELCAMSLHEAMDKIANKTGLRDVTSVSPSPVVCGAILGIVRGVAFLHKQHIVHRDLKPHNILLAPRRPFSSQYKSWHEVRQSLLSIDDLSLFTLKISDMGLGKLLSPGGSTESRRGHSDCTGGVHGTVGWQAPECVVGTSVSSEESSSSPSSDGSKASSADMFSQASSADIFSLGCVLYHVLKPAAHLYGEEWFEREANIVNNRRVGLHKLTSTAHRLVKRMTSECFDKRPSAHAVERDLMFWPPMKKLNFLLDLSDKLELELPASKLLLSVEVNAQAVVGVTWSERIDSSLLGDLSKFRKYDVTSCRALLRVIRNKRHHWHELSEEVQELVKPFPEGLGGYFERLFPELLHHCYEVTKPWLSQDVSFRQYFDNVKIDTAVIVSTQAVVDMSEVTTHCNTDTAQALHCRGWNRPLSHWQQGLDVGLSTGNELSPALQRCASDRKYRTRLCQHWDSSLGCRCPLRGKGKCDFAHGPIELRVKESKLNKWGKRANQEASIDGEDALIDGGVKGLSGGEDTYGAARNVEKIRRDDGKDEVEKRRIRSQAYRRKDRK